MWLCRLVVTKLRVFAAKLISSQVCNMRLRSVRTTAAPSFLHRAAPLYILSLTRTLQAASVTPEPMGWLASIFLWYCIFFTSLLKYLIEVWRIWRFVALILWVFEKSFISLRARIATPTFCLDAMAGCFEPLFSFFHQIFTGKQGAGYLWQILRKVPKIYR